LHRKEGEPERGLHQRPVAQAFRVSPEFPKKRMPDVDSVPIQKGLLIGILASIPGLPFILTLKKRFF
jgi:hypothetical protein